MWLVTCLVTIGGGAIVGMAARRRGRSFVPWALVSTVAAGLVYLVLYALAFSPMVNPTLGTAVILASVAAPALPHIALATLVRAMGHRTPRNRWRVFVDDERAPRTLVLRRDAVVIDGDPDRVIDLATVVGARADCECVRLAWRDGDQDREVVAQMHYPNSEWELRAAMAERAARAISAARARIGGGLPRAQTVNQRPS